MRVLIVNTSEKNGGAAIAANRLMDALRNNGIQAKMLVRDKQTTQEHVISLKPSPWNNLKFIWERLIIWICNLFSTKNLFKVSIANTGFNITHLSEYKEADIIHLHWINQGMLSLKNLQQIIDTKKPIVWTMHDMWECTSICHHAYTCNKFTSECKNCSFLNFPSEKDLAYYIFKKKKTIFQTAPFHFVTVSNWLANQARTSTLLRNKPIVVIPNTLSLSEFKLLDRKLSRQDLGISTEKKVLLFGAARIDDPIKGFNILLKAIQHLIKNKYYTKEELHLITFGVFKQPEKVIHKIPITHTNMGWIKDNSILSKLYSAADVTVSASLYETFGQTLIEAQACGCIPISFNNSGQTDIINHKINGYLAEYLSVESLANGITWGLTEGKFIDKQNLRNEVIHKFSSKTVASQYINLYNKILARTK